MRFMDELRGSEGERCTVQGSGTGTVISIDEVLQAARIRMDDGRIVSFGYKQVNLLGEEKP